MSKRTMALAAVLLAGGIGAASAQGQMSQGQTQGQTQMPAQGTGQVQSAPAENQQMQGQQMRGQGSGQAGNAGAAKSLPPYSQNLQTPATAPLGPNVNKPKVNPSAAGTVTQWKDQASQGQSGDNYEHSGSVGTNANTHPFKSLKAGGEPRQEGMTQPSGVYPPPSSTMNRDAGR